MPKFNLNERSIGFLELVSEQNLANLGVVKDTIVNTMIDAGLKAKVDGLPFRTIVAQLQEQVQDLGRRLSTEAFTGITGFDKSIKSFEFAEAGIEKYVYVGPADDKTRDECLKTLSDPRQATGWTRDEIAGSETPFISTGGYNCRHEWQAFLEDLPAKQLSDKQVTALQEQRRVRNNEIARLKRGGVKTTPTKVEKALTPKQKESVSYYSTTGYSEINSVIRKGITIGDEVQRDINNISSAIKSSQKYKGKLYRGLRFDNKNDFDNFIKQFKLGKTFTDKSFMSTSASDDIASRFYNSDPLGLGKGRVKMEINAIGKNGVDLANMGVVKSEQEILYNINTKFIVESVKTIEELDRYGETIKVFKVVLSEI